jgi:hypothetical protein
VFGAAHAWRWSSGAMGPPDDWRIVERSRGFYLVGANPTGPRDDAISLTRSVRASCPANAGETRLP